MSRVALLALLLVLAVAAHALADLPRPPVPGGIVRRARISVPPPNTVTVRIESGVGPARIVLPRAPLPMPSTPPGRWSGLATPVVLCLCLLPLCLAGLHRGALVALTLLVALGPGLSLANPVVPNMPPSPPRLKVGPGKIVPVEPLWKRVATVEGTAIEVVEAGECVRIVLPAGVVEEGR